MSSSEIGPILRISMLILTLVACPAICQTKKLFLLHETIQMTHKAEYECGKTHTKVGKLVIQFAILLNIKYKDTLW